MNFLQHTCCDRFHRTRCQVEVRKRNHDVGYFGPIIKVYKCRGVFEKRSPQHQPMVDVKHTMLRVAVWKIDRFRSTTTKSEPFFPLRQRVIQRHFIVRFYGEVFLKRSKDTISTT